MILCFNKEKQTVSSARIRARMEYQHSRHPMHITPKIAFSSSESLRGLNSKELDHVLSGELV